MAPITTAYGVDQIGETAGDVWQLLHAQGPLTYARLAKQLDVPRDVVMHAVGWLAREGKIVIRESGRSRVVALQDV